MTLRIHVYSYVHDSTKGVMMGSRRFLQSCALALCMLIGAGCKEDNPVAVVDPRPPDFTLADLDGNTFQLSSTQGKVVLLHFFAPWCPVCQSEAPVLAELHDQFGAAGLVIVAVAVQAVSLDQIRNFKDTYEVPYLILVDDGRVSVVGYGVNSIPTTYFIDKEVALSGPFGPLSKEEFVDRIQPLL